MEFAIILKKVLFRSFIYGFILLLISSFLYMFWLDNMYNWVSNFYPISEDFLIKAVMLILGMWKIALIQFFLFPAIALHFVIKCCSKKEGQLT